MRYLQRIFDFYLEGSVHVALAVFALIQVSTIRLGLPTDWAVSGFGFFGTIVGYNFVKYDALARQGHGVRKNGISLRLKLFISLSALSFIAAAYFFLQLRLTTQLTSAAVLLVTALYTLPFFPNRKNGRNWAGSKIYFVAISWMAVTVFLPVLDSQSPFTFDVYLMAAQRFLLVAVLLFIFEIIDLAWDDPHLHTVPQQIGVFKTKMVGMGLLMICIGLEAMKETFHEEQLWCNFGMIIATGLFLSFAHEGQSRYYTAFWAESLPIYWWLAFLIL